ncbi:L-type lectin-domain containing receptor kinase [Musa troglodytarum]|uniref:L-type lectin-domain containing receptor kinase n=1 Tax=Musa troglodytarum TaxID=320322 RepID=A0A9E7GED9_9LILI|nr:L-type lectin-domain containing receptor kinase [Musa troglodytarum]
MASAFFFVARLLFVVFLSGRSCRALDRATDFCFSFDGFEKNRSFQSEFELYGDAEMSGSAVRVTRPANSSLGRIAYRKSIRFLGTTPGFSSYLSFSIPPGDGQVLAFFLIPSGVPLESDRFGLSTSLVAVKFGRPSHEKYGNGSGTLVEIDVGGQALKKRSNLSGVEDELHSWIDYDGKSKRIEVRLSRSRDSSRPVNSSISRSVDLSNALWREAVTVGMSSWNANSTKTSTLYSWNFTSTHGSPYLMHSEPLNPNSFPVRPAESPPLHPRRAYPWGVFMAMLFAAASGAMLAFFVVFMWLALVSRRPVAPVEYPALPVGVACGKMASAGGERVGDGKK